MDKENGAGTNAGENRDVPTQAEAGSAEEMPARESPAPEQKKDEGNAVTRLYDKLPFTYKQVDIAVKVLIAAFVLFLLFIVLKSPRLGG